MGELFEEELVDLWENLGFMDSVVSSEVTKKK